MQTIIAGLVLLFLAIQLAVSAYMIWSMQRITEEQRALADEYATLTKQLGEVQTYLRGFYHEFDEYSRARRWAPSAPMPQDPADQWNTDQHQSVATPTRQMATVTPLVPRFRGGSHGTTNPASATTAR